MIQYFIKNSIGLDIKFMKYAKFTFLTKIEFLLKKYIIIVKHFIVPFYLGESAVTFDGKKIFYDNKYGLAGLQRIYSSHRKLFCIADLENKNIDNIIDIGANVGYFSMLSYSLFPNANIFSFEPIPETFATLNKNLHTVNKIKVINKGVSASKGTAYMNFNPSESALSSLVETGTKKVDLTTLDDIIHDYNLTKIDLLKIDAECSEQKILEGGYNALSITRYLFLELTLQDNDNYTFSSIISKLNSTEFNFDLLAYRNFANTSEGEMPICELLLKNTKTL